MIVVMKALRSEHNARNVTIKYDASACYLRHVEGREILFRTVETPNMNNSVSYAILF